MKIRESIYKVKHKPPSNHDIGMTNTKFPRKEAKRVASRGLVKISTNYLSVAMYFISISPFLT
jgi:hypothetical protein